MNDIQILEELSALPGPESGPDWFDTELLIETAFFDDDRGNLRHSPCEALAVLEVHALWILRELELPGDVLPLAQAYRRYARIVSLWADALEAQVASTREAGNDPDSEPDTRALKRYVDHAREQQRAWDQAVGQRRDLIGSELHRIRSNANVFHI